MVNSYLWTLDLTRVRFKCGFRQAPILGEVANDNMTLENSAMKIVWKGMITDFDRDVLSAQKLTSGQSLDDFYEHPYEVSFSSIIQKFKQYKRLSVFETAEEQLRTNQLHLESCKKCVWYDMQAPFCNDKKTVRQGHVFVSIQG